MYLGIAANMYLALAVLSTLVFLALCLVGLFTLIRQAIADPPFTALHLFIEDRLPVAAALSSAARTSAAPTYAAPTYAARSEDAERSACGEGCA
jgi:hypothetical protein